MNKPKRKPLASTVESKTKSETIQAVLDEKGKRTPNAPPPLGPSLSRVSTHISSQLDTQMRVFIAKRKSTEKGYNIRRFLESAIADKLAKERIAEMT